MTLDYKGTSKAMWDISKNCFVAVPEYQEETDNLKNRPINPLGYDGRIDDTELKTKCIELAIKFIGTSDNANRGFDVDKIAEKFYKFYKS